MLVHTRGLRLQGWDPQLTVQVGDERGVEGRMYDGDVWNAWICAGAAPAQVCAAPGAGEQTRQQLTVAAEASQQVEVSVSVRSATDHQDGPPCLVTFSQGPERRNVTLSQEGRMLIFRVRTPRSGPNGLGRLFVLPDAVHKDVPTWVVARFVRGVVTIETQCILGTVSATFRPDLLRNSIQLHEPGRTNLALIEMLRGRAATVGVGLLSAALGLAVGWGLRPWRGAAVLLGPALAILSLWAVDLLWLKTLPPGPCEIALVSAASAIGAVLAVRK